MCYWKFEVWIEDKNLIFIFLYFEEFKLLNMIFFFCGKEENGEGKKYFLECG